MLNSHLTNRVATRLIELLSSDNSVVRCAATQTLSVMKFAPAIPALIKNLRDVDEDVVTDSIDALGHLKAKEAVPDLLECYTLHPDGTVKVCAVEALGAIGTTTALEHLVKVVQKPGDDIYWDTTADWNDWWDAQYKAIEILGNLKVVNSATEILNAIDHEDAQELTDVGFKALAKLGIEGLDKLTFKLKNGTALEKRRVITALVENPQSATWSLLAVALKDQEYQVRIRAAKAILAGQAKEFYPQVLTTLRDPFPQVRIEVVTALREYDLPLAEIPIIDLLDDPDLGVCIAALKTVEHFKFKKATERILKLINHSNNDIVVAAIDALGAYNDPQYKKKFLAILDGEGWCASCKKSAVLALKEMVTSDDLPYLLATLQDEDKTVRINSLLSIANCDDPASTNILIAALEGKIVVEPQSQTETVIPEEVTKPETRKFDIRPISAENIQLPETTNEKGPQSSLEAIELQNQEIKKPTTTENVAEMSETEHHFLDLARQNIKSGSDLFNYAKLAPHQDIKQYTARLLAHKKEPAVTAALIAALDDDTGFVVQEVIEALGILRDSASVPHLLPLLDSEDCDICIRTTRALGRIGGKPVLQPLIQVMNRTEPLIRIMAMESLCLIDVELRQAELKNKLLPILTTFLAVDHHGVKKAALRTLLNWFGESVLELTFNPKTLEDYRLWLDVAPLLEESMREPAVELLLRQLSDQELEFYYQIPLEILKDIYAAES